MIGRHLLATEKTCFTYNAGGHCLSRHRRQ